MVQRHVQRIAMYSLPSDLDFGEAGPMVEILENESAVSIRESNLRAVIEQMPAVLWTTDLELTVTFSTGNGLARLNHSVHPFAGMTLSEFFHKDADPTPMITAHLKALGGYAQTFEFGAESALFTGTVEPLFNSDGNLVGTVGALVEITERRRAEQERSRQRAERLEAAKRQGLADLAGLLSRQFNDLLNAISAHATIARMGLESDHPMQPCLGEMEKAAEYAVGLIDQLACPAAMELARREPVDLAHLIKEQVPTFQAFLARTIALQCDLAPDQLAVAGDPELLRRLLLNLLWNAAAAIGADQGTIALRTQITSGPPPALLEQDDGARLPEGNYVWLQVSDTGPGLDRAAKDRIFEPFAGLAAPGMGLAAAKAIVSAHHGAIAISSKPGLGTTCHVLLPATPKDEMLPPESFF